MAANSQPFRTVRNSNRNRDHDRNPCRHFAARTSSLSRIARSSPTHEPSSFIGFVSPGIDKPIKWSICGTPISSAFSLALCQPLTSHSKIPLAPTTNPHNHRATTIARKNPRWQKTPRATTCKVPSFSKRQRPIRAPLLSHPLQQLHPKARFRFPLPGQTPLESWRNDREMHTKAAEPLSWERS